jgi:HSP20 family molecular chaperone IbpA
LSNGFEPKYEYYISDDKLIISLEIPGEYKITKHAKENKDAYTYIKISGTKVNNNEDNLKKNEQKENSFNNKEYGEFNTTIKLENISLDSEKPKISKKDGITTFIFQIKKDEEETEF